MTLLSTYKSFLALKTRCVTWPFWPVRTRPITGQHGPAGQTGQHRPGRVRRTAPAHSTRAAQRHTHSLYTHTRTHTHTASPCLATVLYCVQQHLPLQFSIPKIDMTRPQSLSRSMSCMWFRAVDLRFKTIWPELTLTEILF